ncbi:MAG: response regulator transcription factor [Myxococcales bacterium]|nr:response regulator transcription factor [Myxococcales bacterium]
MASAVGVTVVAAEGAPRVEPLVAELGREVLDGQVASLDALLATTDSARTVVLLCIPARVDAGLLDRVVTWADARRPRPGLIGWANQGSHVDSEAALAAGFDDFVVGARSPRELAARVRAVHRRVHWNGLRRPGRLRHGGLMLDTDGHELWVDGRTISLTSTELAVVRALMRARGRTMSRSELLDHAWGSANFDISERAVDNVVLRLRRKLGRADLIRTVRGVGFRLATDE